MTEIEDDIFHSLKVNMVKRAPKLFITSYYGYNNDKVLILSTSCRK